MRSTCINRIWLFHLAIHTIIHWIHTRKVCKISVPRLCSNLTELCQNYEKILPFISFIMELMQTFHNTSINTMPFLQPALVLRGITKAWIICYTYISTHDTNISLFHLGNKHMHEYMRRIGTRKKSMGLVLYFVVRML